jgi:type I restriction enzyme S subunit
LNLRMLLSNLNLLATAPGGVARLRELILTLAVQGKLVPQDPKDEPASELLKKIRAEKERLIADGKIKRDKPLAEIGEDEKPFELPVGWEWVRVGGLGVTSTGGTPASNRPEYFDGNFPFIGPGQITPSGRVLLPEKFISEAGRLESAVAEPGDILMVCIGGSIGKCAAASFATAFNHQINSVQPLLALSGYVLISMSSSGFLQSVLGAATGSATPIISKGKWDILLLSLPPLAEQSRIVTRVEELMRLCDALEAKGQLAATAHAQLVSTLLGTLTDSETPEQLTDNWHRIATHFDLLLDRPEAVDALEQTILQLAVRGLLVPQDPQDEPASVLLKKIRAEKDKLIAEGKIKRDKPLPPIAEDEQPFALPAGWAWVRLGQMSEIKGGKRLPAGHSFSDEKTPFAYIQVTNMKNGSIATEHLKYLRPETQVAIRNYTISQDDLYITIAGTIGEVGEIPAECHLMNLTENAAKIVFQLLNKRWLREVLNSQICQTQFAEKTVQQAQPKLALHRIADALIPLPPLSEQSRIVTRVAQLRRLCADLRQRLSASQSTQAHLAEALVESIAS